ncbi:hypothetical protein PFISCL1PPCAC_12789, partial [Pristionchus fissidentatus]
NQFDVYSMSISTPLIAGTCITYQTEAITRNELCSCPYRENCSTPTRFTGKSGLPLDTRTEGMIDCLLRSDMKTPRKCRGHACFIAKTRSSSEEMGCITYDERYMNRKMPVGAHEFPSENQYICETDMCNADVDSERVFYGKKSLVPKPPANESCNCFEPPTTTLPVVVADALNLALVLGIAIPAGVVLLLIAAIVGCRLFTKRWPAPLFFLGAKSTGGRGTNAVITVVSKANAKNK